jgi:protein-S-isoprenylcysteine O-methyltransferase Ste14
VSTHSAETTPPRDRRLSTRLALGIAKGFLLFAVPLFAAAGTLDWPEAWVFLGIFLVGTLAISRMLMVHDPALLAERLGPLAQRSQPRWDRILLGAIFLAFLAWLVVIGLDAVRFAWSAVPLAIKIAGGVGELVAWAIFYATFRANTFLAPVVRIQRERGHQVISTGPYAIVRHPLYAGAILFFLATPLLLGSYWGLVLSLVLTFLVALRARLEERALEQGLEGYRNYAANVRYRLVPGIW